MYKSLRSEWIVAEAVISYSEKDIVLHISQEILIITLFNEGCNDGNLDLCTRKDKHLI